MEKCLILIGTVVAVLLVIPGKTDSRVCWEKQWHNNSNPSINGSEFEYLDATQRAALCPGGKVIDAQCADDKHEGFSGNKTDIVNHFTANCSVEHGLVCHPIENTRGPCPDLAIQYGCECPLLIESASAARYTAAPTTSSTRSPSQTKNVTMSPSQTKNVTMSPSQTKNVTMSPSQTKNVSISPSQTKNVTMSPSQTKNVTISPSETKNVTMSPSQTKNVTMSPSQSQASTNDPTQNGNQNQKGGDHNNGNQGQHSVCIMTVLLVLAKFLG